MGVTDYLRHLAEKEQELTFHIDYLVLGSLKMAVRLI